MGDKDSKRMYDNGCYEGFVAIAPELRFTTQGLATSRFSMAINGRWDAETQQTIGTIWLNVIAFGNLAEVVAENIRKGMLVRVYGKFQANEWQTRDGETRTNLELLASKVAILATDKNFQVDPDSVF